MEVRHPSARALMAGIGAVLAAGLLLAAAAPAVAHRVNIFAYAEGDSVHTESYFTDGKKSRNSTITVCDAAGDELLRGTTDDEGLFSFPVSRRQELKIVLAASMGHRAEYVLARAELPGDDTVPTPTPSSPHTPPPPEAGAPISEEMVRAVDRAVAAGMSPLAEAIHRLEKRQEQVGLRDIIGGIGYIVGLMGLIYYLRVRQGR